MYDRYNSVPIFITTGVRTIIQFLFTASNLTNFSLIFCHNFSSTAAVYETIPTGSGSTHGRRKTAYPIPVAYRGNDIAVVLALGNETRNIGTKKVAQQLFKCG